MSNRIEVLDHGFVRLVETWGGGDAAQNPYSAAAYAENECGIIEAARQSTQGAFRGWEKDFKLLKYLYENKHSTPFEFAGMVIEVKAPIFIFRQWQRHRTQAYNEMSARYGEVPNENYIPTIERLMADSKDGNKQAGSIKDTEPLEEIEARQFQLKLEDHYRTFEFDYSQALKNGVPKELARLGMPVGRYSQMRASTSLRNWLAFLTLRLDPHAQQEIREYAGAIAKLIKQEFPKTYELFTTAT